MDESRRVTTCVGIDVSKDRLDVHILPSGEALPSRATAKARKLRVWRDLHNRRYARPVIMRSSRVWALHVPRRISRSRLSLEALR